MNIVIYDESYVVVFYPKNRSTVPRVPLEETTEIVTEQVQIHSNEDIFVASEGLFMWLGYSQSRPLTRTTIEVQREVYATLHE